MSLRVSHLCLREGLFRGIFEGFLVAKMGYRVLFLCTFRLTQPLPFSGEPRAGYASE